MLIIRPTASLAKRLKVRLQSTEAQSSTVLGDWYANDIVLDRKQFILCVSSASRLAVMMDAAPYATFPDRLPDAIEEVLKCIGIDQGKIQQERAEMRNYVLAKTVDKSILGTLNQNRSDLEVVSSMGQLKLKSPLEISLYLSKSISLVLPDGYPREAALARFGQDPSEPKKPVAVLPSRPNLFLIK